MIAGSDIVDLVRSGTQPLLWKKGPCWLAEDTVDILASSLPNTEGINIAPYNSQSIQQSDPQTDLRST